jgi:cytochrome c554/c'-like protein
MMFIRNKKTAVVGVVLAALIAFLAWRLLRPMNIFVVSEAFERPVSTATMPASLASLSAKDCGGCHQEFYEEWSTTIHSQAWTDPYFQVDWAFDGHQQICKNCHIPLDRQQEQSVLGFDDREKWHPILAPNPAFDPKLQHEGVTCAACHLRDGKILGTFGSESAAHPVERLANPNEVCFKCHVVGGNRWDTFFRFPPCGTVAEIRSTPDATRDTRVATVTGHFDQETVGPGDAALDCVKCHMPLAERALVAGGKLRTVRRHLWRGGHDPDMVKQGLEAVLREAPSPAPEKRSFTLTLTNIGAAHYLPTGTPDRHLAVSLRLVDRDGRVLQEDNQVLKRTILWRPFIVELWDGRLPRWQPRAFDFAFEPAGNPTAAAVEAEVRYGLVEEPRRLRIGYENKEPVTYEVFHASVALRRSE